MNQKLKLVNFNDLALTLLITLLCLWLMITVNNKYIKLLLLSSIISANLLLLFSFRNNWTYYNIINFNNEYKKEYINSLHNKSINSNILNQYIEDYSVILWKCWVWDFNKFIYSKKGKNNANS